MNTINLFTKAGLGVVSFWPGTFMHRVAEEVMRFMEAEEGALGRRGLARWFEVDEGGAIAFFDTPNCGRSEVINGDIGDHPKLEHVRAMLREFVSGPCPTAGAFNGWDVQAWFAHQWMATSVPVCVAGCKHYTGGETRHHADCPFYPDSMSQRMDRMEAGITKIKDKALEMIRVAPPYGLPCDAQSLVDRCLDLLESTPTSQQ